MNPLPAGPPPDSLVSRVPTTPADQIPIVPGASWDAPDFGGISDRSCARPLLFLEAAHCRAPKIGLCPVNSRALIEIALRHLRENLRVFLILGLNFIEQSRKAGAGSSISSDSIPCGIAVQFGQQLRQVFDQLLSLSRSERTDGRFNFLYGAHLLNRYKGAVLK